LYFGRLRLNEEGNIGGGIEGKLRMTLLPDTQQHIFPTDVMKASILYTSHVETLSSCSFPNICDERAL
jgi:hypothetical protein